jgi:hypothetical protein
MRGKSSQSYPQALSPTKLLVTGEAKSNLKMPFIAREVFTGKISRVRDNELAHYMNVLIYVT